MNGLRLGETLIGPTNRSSSAALVHQLVALPGRVRTGRVRAVGIEVPSVVEFDTGRVVSSVNVPLADLPLRQLRAVAHNLVLTIGTGVRGGLVVGGRIYRGATDAAGELLLAPAARVARAYALPGIGTRTTIRLARTFARGGVLGAAQLAMRESGEP
jgi:predicted NBD/HSP70 family sugar kinase